MARKLTSFKIGDQSIGPGDVHIRDLRDALEQFEKALIAEAKQHNPDLKTDDLVVALVEISKGSDLLTLEVPKELGESTKSIEKSVRTGDYSRLSRGAHEALYKLDQKIVPKYRAWGVAAGKWPQKNPPMVSAEKRVPEPIQAATLKSHTTLFGRVIRIGGMTPKIGLEVDGRMIPVEISIDLAKRVGPRIYEVVGLEGVATWNAGDLQIVDFKATNLLDYDEGDLARGFKDLARIAGPTLEKIDLVKHFAAERKEDG